ncbi:MAG: ligase-associated DNA damage response exonuclease [Bacteroidota bacterium]
MLLTFTNRGIYCQQADIFIDPWKPVPRALVTHGHSDHARWGNKHYLCTHTAKHVIQYRLGQQISIDSVEFGETVMINGVKFSFHPAGHIIGSAQIRVEYKGEVWVVSGDYKVEPDNISEPFELVKCHAFITESTFGLPVYRWKPQQLIFDEIHDWWQQNQQAGKVSIITAYSLGKAQRIIQNLDHSIGPVFTHGAVENTNEVIRNQGISLKSTRKVGAHLKKADYKGGLVICPGSALGTSWQKKFQPFSVAVASGWMTLRGARRRRAVDRGFVLSDHADWDGLNTTIAATGAEKVFVTHGYTAIYSKWLREQGYDAKVVETEYGTEEETPTNPEAAS